MLRFYNKIKHSFWMEKYLFGVKNNKYRTALAKLRSSSHTLAIETGRHSRPKLQVHERLCQVCQCIEDETHLMIGCEINTDERSHLFTRVTRVYPAFESLPNVEKCRFLLSNQDNQIMTWVGKFIYKVLPCVQRHWMGPTKITVILYGFTMFFIGFFSWLWFMPFSGEVFMSILSIPYTVAMT